MIIKYTTLTLLISHTCFALAPSSNMIKMQREQSHALMLKNLSQNNDATLISFNGHMPHSNNYSLNRALSILSYASYANSRPLYNNLPQNTTPPLRQTAEPNPKTISPQSMDQYMTTHHQAKFLRAQGRSLLYKKSDGTIVVIKIRKQGETLGTLQYESQMQTFIPKHFQEMIPTQPITSQEGHHIFRCTKDRFSTKSENELAKQTTNSGNAYSLHNENSDNKTSYDFIMYRIENTSTITAEQAFTYLEDVAENHHFKTSLKHNAKLFGQLKAKGFIHEAISLFHNVKSDRSFVWMAEMMLNRATKSGTGKATSPLQWAKFSDLRALGLMDPEGISTFQDFKNKLKPQQDTHLLEDTNLENLQYMLQSLGNDMISLYLIVLRRLFANNSVYEKDAAKKDLKEAFEELFSSYLDEDTDALAFLKSMDLARYVNQMIDEADFFLAGKYVEEMERQQQNFSIYPQHIITKIPQLQEIPKTIPQDMQAYTEKLPQGWVQILIKNSEGMITKSKNLGWISSFHSMDSTKIKEVLQLNYSVESYYQKKISGKDNPGATVIVLNQETDESINLEQIFKNMNEWRDAGAVNASFPMQSFITTAYQLGSMVIARKILPSNHSFTNEEQTIFDFLFKIQQIPNLATNIKTEEINNIIKLIPSITNIHLLHQLNKSLEQHVSKLRETINDFDYKTPSSYEDNIHHLINKLSAHCFIRRASLEINTTDLLQKLEDNYPIAFQIKLLDFNLDQITSQELERLSIQIENMTYNTKPKEKIVSQLIKRLKKDNQPSTIEIEMINKIIQDPSQTNFDTTRMLQLLKNSA